MYEYIDFTFKDINEVTKIFVSYKYTELGTRINCRVNLTSFKANSLSPVA